MAQLVIQAAGAAIGYMVGGPLGGSIGWSIGGMLAGSNKSQTRIQGPSQPMMDLRVTGSEYGQAIPYVRGAVSLAGQMWWNTDRRATTTVTTSGGGGGGGGKGGGGGGGGSPVVETTTITYDMDMLLGLTDNVIIGIARIWINGALVFTASSGAATSSIDASEVANAWTRLTVYSGAASQLPDPTYEAAVGAGNAPAYRGRGSVFIESLKLGTSGQIPNITFEVVADGEVNASSAVILCHFDGANGASSTTDDGGNAVSLANATLTTAQAKFGASSIDLTNANASCLIVGPTSLGSAGWTMEGWFRTTVSGTAFRTYFAAVNNSGFGAILYSNVIAGQSRRFSAWMSSNGTSNDIGQLTGSAYTETLSVWHHVAFVRDTATQRYYAYFDGVVSFNSGIKAAEICAVTKFFFGTDGAGSPTVLGGLGDEFRVSATCLYPGGTTFTPPTRAGIFTPGVIINDPPTVQSVVSDLCVRAGLTTGQIDVTGLSSITRDCQSMAISQIGPTRGTLELLMSTYFFELVNSDKIYFRPRGSASVVTIPYLDLGASAGDAKEPLELQQANDLEIPAQIAVTYVNINDDYQTDTQYSDRLISAASGTVEVRTMAIGMTPDEAKAVADTMLLDMVASGISTTVDLLGDYSYLEPTDAVTITASDGSTLRMRLVKHTRAYPVLTFDAVLDDTSVLTSQGITSTDYTSTTTVAPPVDTEMKLLDIPILQDSDSNTGFYVAAKGDGTPYLGSAIFNSSDDVTYTRRATVLEAAVFGWCTTKLGDWTGPRVVDELNTVTVNVGDGELASSTRDAVLSSTSINAMLIGSELIQFITATLVSPGVYTLSRLLRGGRGTEWAMTGHAVVGSPSIGERAVLLQVAGLRRIILENNELGVSKYYKGVTLGRAISSATAESFTNTAIGLKPFSPIDFRVARDDSGNITATWERRTRMSVRVVGTLGISVPLGEDSEAYRLDIYADGTYATVIVSIDTTSPTADYSAADQTTDFGSPQAVIYCRVYQISATVGDGYVLEASG